jgi:molybdopterin-guanine dinucleotide biosynthesis protein A
VLRFDAIVLAGGSATRLGGIDKPMLPMQGVPMLVRVLDSLRQAGRRIVVGPERAGIRDVVWIQEDPVGGGPVAGLAAGVSVVEAEFTFVLAADQPWIGGAVTPLVDALEANPDAHAVMLQRDGRMNPLAALWRRESLCDALAALPEVSNAAMRSLAAHSSVVTLADTGGWSRDYDTWLDLDRNV